MSGMMMSMILTDYTGMALKYGQIVWYKAPESFDADGDDQPLSPLGAAAGKDGPAVFCPHSFSEPVVLFLLTALG